MKIWIFLLSLVVALVVVASPQPSFAKYASIVVNETTGKVMYSRNADKKLFPASLTKVMTLYIVFEEIEAGRMNLDTRMKVSRVAAGRSPSKLWLRTGTTIRVRDAIKALITKSANDAATVISEHISGTEREFAKRMTRKARALGMTKTTFRNASGLPHSQQLSTARDMARLAIAIRKDFPKHFALFKTKSFSWKGKRFRNHNKLLSNYIGTDGIKTGYIRASGFNLIATVERKGTRLVGVVFGGKTGRSRDKHMRYLLTKQFNRLPTLKAPSPTQAKASIISTPPPRPEHIKAQKQIELAALAKPVLPADLPQLADPVPKKRIKSRAWSIQIGSFSRQANAHIAARDARHAAIKLLRRQPAVIKPVQFSSAIFWRVQFHGFNENKAREACLELHQRSIACIAVPANRV
jgi:D-alanyl-D-alanine carboxypeptidase